MTLLVKNIYIMSAPLRQGLKTGSYEKNNLFIDVHVLYINIVFPALVEKFTIKQVQIRIDFLRLQECL